MHRRAFLAGALTLLTLPRVAVAQAPVKVARVAVASGNFSKNDGCLDRLRKGLADLGYVEGRTHRLEVRWAEGEVGRFPAVVAELVALRPDVIVGFTGTVIPIIMQATSTIPIVMTATSYPVEQGYVASLARPGRNVTGLALLTSDLVRKRVQILKEALPRMKRLTLIRTDGAGQELMGTDVEAAAHQFGVDVNVLQVRRAEELPSAFETAARSGADAVMTSQGPFFALHRTKIAELALKHRLPSLSGETIAADAGMLLFYGPHVLDQCQRVSTYVDRILKGAKPADLPVEQPARVELIVNLKTAKALSLTIPPSLLLRADQVIE